MLTNYETVLKIAEKHGTKFKVPELDLASPEYPILRHDIDFLLTGVEEMAELESDFGFQAIYLFRYDANTYNFFSTRCQEVMRRILKLGHCVGVHIDRRRLNQKLGNSEVFTTLLANAQTALDSQLRFVSWHRPLESDLGVVETKYKGLNNLYAKAYWNKNFYLSDSAGSWSEEKTQRFTELCKSTAFFQLLIHPEWWLSKSSGASFNYAWSKQVIQTLDDLRTEIRSYDNFDLAHTSLEYLCTNKFKWLSN